VFLSIAEPYSFALNDVRHEIPSRPVYAHDIETIDRAIDVTLEGLALGDKAARDAAEKRRVELCEEFERQAEALSDPSHDEAERLMNEAGDVEAEAAAALAETVATTMPGLISMLRYVCLEQDGGMKYSILKIPRSCWRRHLLRLRECSANPNNA
jgi:hypothetical protein